MTQSPTTSLQIAVAGNPNSGKTTLFNALTGLRMKVGNYPGVTVEKREGPLTGTNAVLLDLPGVYSLSARSPDEEIARDVLQGRIPGVRRPDVVLLVLDAANLERNLYLATQILDFGAPVVIALNMIDVARRRGVVIDHAALARLLGVPVIPTVASEGEGLDAIRKALTSCAERPPARRPWSLPPAFEAAVEAVAAVMRRSAAVPPRAVSAGALLWLMDYLSGDAPSRRSAERFLGRLSSSDAAALRAAAEALAAELPDAAATAIEARYEWIAGIAAQVVSAPPTAARPGEGATDRIDRYLTHRVIGPVFFAAVMFVLFLSIFAWAQPLMALIEFAQNAVAGLVGDRMSEGPLRSLMTDGVIAGVGAVVAFFPQICILFLCLGVLEDSGYMARAAFIMDRVMSRVGLHGKSFIPLLSSYACAIPGILATRTIEDRRDRFTTIMVAPLMSCSARLPVYIIVIGAVFGDRPWLAAGVMFSMYALGTLTALAMALLFKKTLFAGPRPPFIMELPPYHLPRLSALLRTTWDRSKLFLTNAGTTIFAVCVVIWALSYFPRTDEQDFSPEVRARLAALDAAGPAPSAASPRVGDGASHAARTADPSLLSQSSESRANLIAAERLRLSCLGRLGRFLEPAIEPLGFDWRIGVGILSSFLAREVFVGTIGITFAVGEADEESVALREKLATAVWPDGRPVLTPVTGVGLMVFYVLACQCISTLAVVRKETGSWRWPALMFAYMSVLAYVGAFLVFQIGARALG
ncbi:MAG: ferrous iron transport protein B [Planctomycetota bacterium]|nr:MAG: ferrous iron transport protein B [Planctomycetota bacterium]